MHCYYSTFITDDARYLMQPLTSEPLDTNSHGKASLDENKCVDLHADFRLLQHHTTANYLRIALFMNLSEQIR
ncbi:hypothetical protein BBBOND_0206100 [Babesia bigemina]|uniref:Uncharacterized protein n=1 Tax=Babesia bigemina TaxID=5866 RepID=A0A061D608_BABBI|nr:hypothetical protein BBBOND_0206100 [Babesia bigemina]CDR95452.1 hypothetical protein BBBOND_0206100 [Babesia bigemina]|eukprot:XP_012767638.1 hypothetical protein BBBOND_0206100 [Babesia bigemina]